MMCTICRKTLAEVNSDYLSKKSLAFRITNDLSLDFRGNFYTIGHQITNIFYCQYFHVSHN